jgi:hypothetical protein
MPGLVIGDYPAFLLSHPAIVLRRPWSKRTTAL